MTPNQRKKGLNTVRITSSRQQSRAKKKNLGLLQWDLNMKSNISLEWDDKKKNVVAKKEQIGLARRDLISFTDYVPHCHNILADVLVVPREYFELDNLKEVLSYEVWQTCLSEKERNYLTQFLPKGTEADRVVQDLLVGDNFHFGNPFLKWGGALCSGNLHPDAVLHQEQCFKTRKKSYYSELQKYHNSIIGNLLMWKERCASCKDPEEEVVHKIWRFRKQAERSISTDANESRDHDAEENLGATSESGSWAANESSDNQYLMAKHGELQKCQGFTEDKYDSLSAGHKAVVRPRKGEKLHKQNIHCGDGSRYMSYIKVTREQHHRVKCSMKNSSNNCIQSRSLNRVLGNLDTFNAQPIEVFEEEERKKLHQHWLQLATKDLPVAFAYWRTQWIKKWQLAQSLAQEMEEKLKSLKEDEEKENPDTIVQEIIENEVAKHEPTLEDDNESLPVSTHNQHLLPIPSLSGSHEFHPMDLDSNNQVIMETDDIPANGSNYPENFNCVGIAASQGDPPSSTSDVWPAESPPDSYYLSTSLNHCYASASKRPLGHLQILEKQPARLINPEPDNRREDTLKDLLHIQRNERSFFNSYPDQEVPGRNELLQRFFKGQEGLRYHHEEKQTRLDLQPASNVSMETGQFSGHFREQLHPSLPLELRRKKLNDDIYMHQNIQEKIFSGGDQYSIPRQEHLVSVNVQDWAVNSTHVSKPLQSQLDGGELGRNWFPGEHRIRCGWRSLDGVGPTQSIVNRSNADDQSLFGVVTQRNELHPGAPYDSVGSSEHYIQPGTTYGAVGALISTASNVLPPPQAAAHPLNYFREYEDAASVAMNNNNIGCMSMRHQNSALQESMVKPFLRPWNK